MKKTKSKNNFHEIERGEVIYLKKLSLIVLVVSNKLHNLFSNYLTVILVMDENTEQVRESLEIPFELGEGKKFKALVSYFHTINKQNLYEEGISLGKVNEKVIEKLNEKIKSILDLNE